MHVLIEHDLFIKTIAFGTMLFSLSSLEYNNTQLNTTKVTVHLRNGVAEILNQHQDLIGQIDNDIVEIETLFENKIEKTLFVVQRAVVVVSKKRLDSTLETKETSVYVYAKRAQEINSSFSIDEISKELQLKSSQLALNVEEQREIFQKKTMEKKDSANSQNPLVSAPMLLLEEDIDFLKKILLVAKKK